MHKVDGQSQSYYEANVVPDYPINRFLINSTYTTEGDLTTPVTPVAGHMHTITIYAE